MTILITQGDSNGIGLEVGIKAIRQYYAKQNNGAKFTLVANVKTLSNYIQRIALNATIEGNNLIIDGISVPILNTEPEAEINFGCVRSDAGALSGAALAKAIPLVQSGEYSALLTLPINKESLSLGGYQFTGHTEMLANFCNIPSPLMILCAEHINVALATIHIPLSQVSSSITKHLLHRRIEQLFNSISIDYGIPEPKIAILSLNPHSGENGKIGSEENDIIIPAMQSSAHSRFLFGPFASDGFFAHGEYKQYDGILAMYHDQGLIPLKIIAKGAGVNFTAGLPIIRTSPDHGTGFAIAGEGVAEFESTLSAIELAEKIFNNRSKLSNR